MLSFRKLSFVTFLLLGSLFTCQADLPDFPKRIKQIDKAEGLARIEAFRNQRLHGDYSFNFVLRHISSRDLERTYYGTLWGSWNESGPITRLTLSNSNQGSEDINLLLQNGPSPSVWIQTGNTPARQMDEKEVLSPIFDNIVYTPFDILMSYLYWPNFDYEGTTETKGRPAYQFFMHAPKGYKKLSGVRIYLDASYHVPLKSESIFTSPDNKKTLRLLNFKKVQDEYIIISLDVKDERSRDKTRFKVTSAALGLIIPHEYFSPEALGKSQPHVPQENYEAIR